MTGFLTYVFFVAALIVAVSCIDRQLYGSWHKIKSVFREGMRKE